MFLEWTHIFLQASLQSSSWSSHVWVKSLVIPSDTSSSFKVCSDSSSPIKLRVLSVLHNSTWMSLLSDSACHYFTLSVHWFGSNMLKLWRGTQTAWSWREEQWSRWAVRGWERCSRHGQVPTWGTAAALWSQPLPRLSCGSSCPCVFKPAPSEQNKRKGESCVASEETLPLLCSLPLPLLVLFLGIHWECKWAVAFDWSRHRKIITGCSTLNLASVSLPLCLSVSLSLCLSASLPLCLSSPQWPQLFLWSNQLALWISWARRGKTAN